MFSVGVKYAWWSYAKGMIRAYPVRVAQYEDIISMSVTPSLSGMPHASTPGDPVGEIIGRAEKQAQYKEYWSVKRAIDICKGVSPAFCDFVRLYYWTTPRLHLEEIAAQLNYSPDTIRKWNKRLIYTVARERGLYD